VPFWERNWEYQQDTSLYDGFASSTDQCQELLVKTGSDVSSAAYIKYHETFGEESSPIWFGSCHGQNKNDRLSFRLVIEASDIVIPALPITITRPIGKVVDDSKDDVYFVFKVAGPANCAEGYCNCNGDHCTEQDTFTSDNLLFCKYAILF